MITKDIIGLIYIRRWDFWNDPNLLAHKFKKENLYGLLFQSQKMNFTIKDTYYHPKTGF